ncbi:MAG: LptF/LptG family permease [Endomicrobium sp.]|jgi:lipopolysaccharide export system permease protein|nr:LptF/LptG family permease [Endomicrobium sp.]
MTKILYKYIIKSFIKVFPLITAALALVILISQLLGLLNFYIEYKVSFYLIVMHLLSKLPERLTQCFPIATLLTILFSIGNLTKYNEITAIKAAGTNINKIIMLLIIISSIIGICDFAIREFIVPKTSSYNEKIKKEKSLAKTDFYNQIIVLPNNIRMTVDHLDIQTNVMKNIVMEEYDSNFILKCLILAEELNWKNNSWVLKNGILRNFDSDFWKEFYFKDYNLNIHITPKDLAINDVRYSIMNIRTLKKYIKRLQIFGQNTVTAKIALNIRFASSFCHIIIMMIGLALTMNIREKFSKIFIFILFFVIVFAYFGIQAITKSLGENSMIHPFFAAWLPNIIFLTLGIYLLIKLKK